MTFEQLKETFRAQGQGQYIDFLDHITKPQGKGDWTLSTNPKNPAPQLWRTWKNELCIQDAASLQDYPFFEPAAILAMARGKGWSESIQPIL